MLFQCRFAEQYGAAGVILYDDPWDINSGSQTSFYPDSWWMPPTGLQMGEAWDGTGDPLTPGYPSLGVST